MDQFVVVFYCCYLVVFVVVYLDCCSGLYVVDQFVVGFVNVVVVSGFDCLDFVLVCFVVVVVVFLFYFVCVVGWGLCNLVGQGCY